MKIYITRRNADMDEGRGPMVNDLVFLHRHHAVEYIDTKEGVWGRKGPWSNSERGDWDVIEVDVLDCSFIDTENEKKRKRAEALAKLTPSDREILGLPER